MSEGIESLRPEMQSIADRFWPKVDASGDCWEWTASRCCHGYGRIAISKRPHLAHRVVWELLVGDIPDGLVIDHRCYRPHCVNPDHLEAVTPAENHRRQRYVGDGPGSYERAKTHCPHGHPYSGRNLIVRRNGKRVCRVCSNKWARQRYARRKEERGRRN